MISVGITGQSGFVGTHLYARLNMLPDSFKTIPFEDSFFESEDKLRDFVKQCDVILHLAALVRSPNKGEVYKVNMELADKLINAIEKEQVVPSLFFASSIQEGDGTEYGQYKLEVRERFELWAKMNGTGFGGMIFPNLFGPNARPNSHSFIATFCYRLTHGEEPKVLVDNTVNLKFIDTLMEELIPMIVDVVLNKKIYTKSFEPDYRLKVSEVLSVLQHFLESEKTGIPVILNSQAEKDLFETYSAYKNYTL